MSNIYRTCPTRTATGMSSVSNVQSAAALWWKRPFLPRMICCSALNAMQMIIPPSAMLARKQSCQVSWYSDNDDELWWWINFKYDLLRQWKPHVLKLLRKDKTKQTQDQENQLVANDCLKFIFFIGFAQFKCLSINFSYWRNIFKFWEIWLFLYLQRIWCDS